jgi:WD40 repeat protein
MTGSLLHRLSIHKYSIQSLSFSFNDNYLASLGGVEDNYLIVWDVQTGKALCGNTAGTDVVHQVKFLNTVDDQLVTCQNYGIKIWNVDFIQKKLKPSDVNFGNLKRQITSICIEPLDRLGYFGTNSGDILEIDLKTYVYKRIGPLKRLFSQGISVIKLLPNSDIIVGTGEGVIAKIGFADFKVKVENKVLGAVTSISLTADSSYSFIGTDQSNIYWCESSTLNNEIRNTCHYDKINDIAFPQ